MTTSNFKVVLLGEGTYFSSSFLCISPFLISSSFSLTFIFLLFYQFERFLNLIHKSPGSVGKTSLVTRYVQNTFNEKHVTTIQASFLTKRLNVDGNRVNLSIWVRNSRDSCSTAAEDRGRANLWKAAFATRSSTGYSRTGTLPCSRSHLLSRVTWFVLRFKYKAEYACMLIGFTCV